MKENHNKDNILFYFVLFCFIVSILLGLIILITDFMKSPIPNYLKYGFKTAEVAKMYQKEYVPEIQKYIQTTDLPDVTIKVDRCSYTEYNKAYGVPVYQLDFTYSSHTVDDYYESAIDSKRGAKDLFYKILEVNGNKNYYENESKIFWNGEPFESEGRMVLFQEDDRYRTDPSYRQGVDDGFDETDEDY